MFEREEKKKRASRGWTRRWRQRILINELWWRDASSNCSPHIYNWYRWMGKRIKLCNQMMREIKSHYDICICNCVCCLTTMHNLSQHWTQAHTESTLRFRFRTWARLVFDLWMIRNKKCRLFWRVLIESHWWTRAATDIEMLAMEIQLPDFLQQHFNFGLFSFVVANFICKVLIALERISMQIFRRWLD